MTVTDTEEHLYTVGEIADMFRVSKMTIYRECRSGEFPGSLMVGRSIRIPQSALDQYKKRAAL